MTGGAPGYPAAGRAAEVFRAVEVLGQEFVHVTELLRRASGVNDTDFRALAELSLVGPLPAGTLARRLGVSTAATTAVIDRLERSGHVVRAPDPNDRRRVVVTRTDLPAEVVRTALLPLFVALDEAVAERTDEELAAIADFLLRLAAECRRLTSGE